jgi:hypothetical protein
MTEAEWLDSNDPWQMLCHIKPKASSRKLRLWVCAALRRHITSKEEAPWQSVDLGEKWADSEVSRAEVSAFRKKHRPIRWTALVQSAFDTARVMAQTVMAHGLHSPEQAPELLREVFGNPFRPVQVAPEWLAACDRAALRLAEAIYREQAWDRMPILADALEDAGCADADILTHSRSARVHVRGCWLLDVLLDRT